MADMSDPCAYAAELREEISRRLLGKSESQIRTRTLDAEDFVAFSQTGLADLRAELRAAEAACAALTGSQNPNRRHAIGLRSKRGY